MKPVHPLLQRQIRLHFRDPGGLSQQFQSFLDAVNEAYNEFDSDRGILERSLDLSSQELLEANSHLRAVLQAFPDLFIWLDSQDTILDVKGGNISHLFPHTTGIIGKRIRDIPLVSVRTKFAQAAEQVRRTNALVRVEYALPVADADVFHEVRLLPLPAGRLLAIIRDITDWKHAEDAIRSSEERYRVHLNALSDMAYLKDEEYRHVMANQALLAFFGRREEDVIGKTDFDLMPEPAAANCRKGDVEAIQSGSLVISEEVVGNRYFETRKYPVRLASGKVGVGGFIRDITERKQAEEKVRRLNEELELRVKARTLQLEEAVKELEAFSYSVSHDLRAPLRAIDGFSQTVLDDATTSLSEESRAGLKRIRAAAQRMGRLIDSLLQLSRLSRRALHLVAVNLSQIARAVVQDLQRRAQERDVSIVIMDDVILNGDADMMRIVLENLLENAWKFTSRKAHATIEFGAEIRDGKTVCFVRDDGAGFDMAYANKLFGAFQRLHNEQEFAGVGIGLATVQRVVQRHGGRVWAEGHVDGGATFFFSI